jgi:hypothetical protein
MSSHVTADRRQFAFMVTFHYALLIGLFGLVVLSAHGAAFLAAQADLGQVPPAAYLHR